MKHNLEQQSATLKQSVNLKRRAAIVLGLASITSTRLSMAQSDWPNRAIHLVVPFSAGGAADTSARAFAAQLTEILGQNVVVENRTGGNAVVAAGAVLQAPRDGYTFIWDAANCLTNPVLVKDLAFDYQTSFTPITLPVRAPQVIAVRQDFPAKNIREFFEYVRAHPGKVSCGTPPSGGMAHLALALLQERANIQLIHTPYRGGADAARDIMGGQIDSILITASSARGPYRAGKARLLAVTSAERSSVYPDVPTLAESGLPGYDMDDWFGLFAAKGTPEAVLPRMQEAIVRAAKSPALISSMEQAGQVPVANSTQDFTMWLNQQRELLQKLIRTAKITVS
jgi:tripartite-type tricarboxylate transporter receptor subunit TctC